MKSSEARSFEIAEIEKLLASGGNYRLFNEAHGKKWLAEMVAGRWVQPHHVAVVLGPGEKTIVDGQHRLWAAAEFYRLTRRKIRFLVCVCVNEEEAAKVALTTDTGKPRKISDHLRHIGADNITALAAALRTVATVPPDGTLSAGCFDNSSGVTVGVLASIYDSDRKALDSATSLALTTARQGSFGYVGLLAGLIYLIRRVSKDGADKFFARLGEGADLRAGDPILLLRRYLGERKGEGVRRAVLRRAVVAAIIIKAWNSWSNGERPKLLRWMVNGDKGESFPQIGHGDPTLWSDTA